MSNQSGLWQDEQHRQQLCLALLSAESEEGVIQHLQGSAAEKRWPRRNDV